MAGWIALSVLAAALCWAVVHDTRQRRRGVRLRAVGDVEREALQHRMDIDAVPYEPARHAGQRDWATYRQRDRKQR